MEELPLDFEVAPAAAERVLERLIAVAESGAQSLHRIQQEDADGEASVNYLIAKRITVQLQAGEVHQVDAVGDVRGVHLQPMAAPPAATAAEGGQ